MSEIDERLAEKLTSQQDVGPFVDRIENVIRTTCNATFKQYSSQKKAYKGEISPLVVDRTYYNEEKNYCTKEEITKNTEQ